MARTPKPTAGRQDINPGKTSKPDHVIRDAANDGANAEPSGDLDRTHDPNAFKVGYGQPPLHSRFKPGQSGNPKGREKNSRNMRTILQQVLNEDMQIRQGNGRVRRMATVEALVRTILGHAFKGEFKAVASLLLLVKQCGYGADHNEPAADLLAGIDPKAIISDFINRNGSEARMALETTPAEETPASASSAPSAFPPKKPT